MKNSSETAKELQARLREAFVFDQETGIFFHRKDGVNKKSMTKACSKNKAIGYMTIRWDGRNAYAHRMAWVYVYGEYPKDIDHINGDRADNRIVNLRSVSHAENLQNLKNAPLGSNPMLGVSRCKRTGRYEAYIQVNGRKKSLGRHTTPEAAHAAYLAAKSKLHTANPIPREVAP